MKTEDGKGGCGLEESKANGEDVREKKREKRKRNLVFKIIKEEKGN